MTTPAGSRGRVLASNLAIYAITGGVFVVLFRHFGLPEVAEVLGRLDPAPFLAALVLTGGLVGAASVRLRLLVAATGTDLSPARCARLVLATFPLNAFLPSKGGDLLKSLALRDAMPLSTGVGLVVLERLIDLATLCALAALGGLAIGNGVVAGASVFALLLLAVALAVLGRVRPGAGLPRFLDRYRGLGVAAHALLAQRRKLVRVVAVSATIWIVSAAQVFLLYRSVGARVSFAACLALVPVAVFVGLLPLTLAGMGTRDAAFVYLFASHAHPAASLATGILFTVCRYFVPAIVGLPALREIGARLWKDWPGS